MPRYVVLFTVGAASVSGPPYKNLGKYLVSGALYYFKCLQDVFVHWRICSCKQVRCILVKVQWGRIPSNKHEQTDGDFSHTESERSEIMAVFQTLSRTNRGHISSCT